MLNIKTVRSNFSADGEKEVFCFRSTTSQNLDEKFLVKEMLSYNSSFTEADISGMMSILETVVNKNLAKGYTVCLPFGSVRANATGTCGSISGSFSAGSGNHQVGFIFAPSEGTQREVSANLQYRQLPPDAAGEGHLYRISSLDDDAKETELVVVKAADKIRLHGRNLSFDSADKAQGVFLENEAGKTRIAVFDRKGTNLIDFRIPADIGADEYSVSVVTKPGKEYCTACISKTIIVESA